MLETITSGEITKTFDVNSNVSSELAIKTLLSPK
jgi:hypothetical protein